MGMVGSTANESLDTIFPKIDSELGKLYEDRNVILTDGGLITFTGTDVQFTEQLQLTINSRTSGLAPITVLLGNATQTLANGQSCYAVINRSSSTPTVGMTVSTNLPIVDSTNTDVYLLFKRKDAGDGTQRLYFRNGMALNAGQTVRLGASGSGGTGSGTGSPLTSLQYRAEFNDGFDEGPTATTSAVDSTKTNAVYSAAKSLYTLSYDATKTVTGTGTSMTLSGAPAFTIAANDMLIVGSEARRITSITSQTVFTIESAFTTNPSAAAACVSQAIQTKDIYNLSVDGYSLASAFGSATFSEALVTYEDTTTAGDNIFDVNTTPVVAYAASVDGSTYTSIKVRAANETDTAPVCALPAAGTSLYLRFFANKTSGSGTVNALRYDAYMQKSTAYASGGTQNSALCFTNSVGTPVNCTVSTMAGKTAITLNFQYAVGVNAGQPYGSLDVYLDGKLLPRFVDATLTPDASFTELSSNVILLDRDYSGLNLSVEVLQRTGVIDTSTTNTTQISSLAEIAKNGFQSFVSTSNVLTATSVAGAPTTGKFFSTITNRASITDLTQDLKVSYGIERISARNLYPINNEFGPGGEPVFGLTGDERVRFVGSSWINLFNVYSGGILNANTVGDYFEVTFYGTGLNILGPHTDSVQRNFQYSVDGGSVVSVTVPSNGSGTLYNRGYSVNQVVPVVSGLALGTHTVRLINNTASAGNGFGLVGLEIIGPSAAINVNPGVAYVNGVKNTLTSAQSLAYNSGFESGTLGTRGGRVVAYLKSDGTVGRAVTPASSQVLGSGASHANEDIARTYLSAEFAAGSVTSDFGATAGTAYAARAFTINDGTTTLASTSAGLFIYGNRSGIGFTANCVHWFIFVGTGLDIELTTGSTETNTYAMSIDNVSVGNLAYTQPASGSVTKTYRVASGLPYGTHVFKIVAGATTPVGITLNRFIVYQPKKPTIPSGAIELADYNVMANYVDDTANGIIETVSTGVLWKQASREHTLIGTGWALNVPTTNTLGAQHVASAVAGNYLEYSFWGTGIEVVGVGSGSSLNIKIDGANYTGAATALGTSSSWTPGTSTWVGASVNGGKLMITGLSLGMHTIRVTLNTSVSYFHHGFHVITPIHSTKNGLYNEVQNELPIGSCALSDNRKITAIKELFGQTQTVVTAQGMVSGPTTTSTGDVMMPDMIATINCVTGRLIISYSATIRNNSSGSGLLLRAYVDGLPVGTQKGAVVTTNYWSNVSDVILVNVGPGIHTVQLYWAIAGTGTGDNIGTNRTLLVAEY